MSMRLYGQAKPISVAPMVSVPSSILQRKCACGGTPGPTGECAECRRKRLGIQPKLTINQPGDKYEQEADRVAGQVMRMPEPRLQRQTELEDDDAGKPVRMAHILRAARSEYSKLDKTLTNAEIRGWK